MKFKSKKIFCSSPYKAMFILGARVRCLSKILAGHQCDHTFFPGTHTRSQPCTQELCGTWVLAGTKCLNATLFCASAQAPVLRHAV